MKDAGQPLRGILKQQFDVALYCQAIDSFTSMQLATEDHINIFFDMDVPDWRLDKLPDFIYAIALTKKRFLIKRWLIRRRKLMNVKNTATNTQKFMQATRCIRNKTKHCPARFPG